MEQDLFHSSESLRQCLLMALCPLGFLPLTCIFPALLLSLPPPAAPFRVPHAIQTQLGEVFRTVVYNDYPEKWPGLLPELCTSLASQVRARVCTLC